MIDKLFLCCVSDVNDLAEDAGLIGNDFNTSPAITATSGFNGGYIATMTEY